MGILGDIILWSGLLMFVCGAFQFLVVSFQEGVWWGLGVLLIPLFELVFLFTHWNVAAKPFFLVIGGVALAAAGGLVS